MHFTSTVFAAFVACTSLASAECWGIDGSLACDVWGYFGDGDWLCHKQCRAQGDSGGHCEPRDGCVDLTICVCDPPARKRDGPDNDVEVEVKEFLRAITKEHGGNVEVEVDEFLREATNNLDDDETEKFFRSIKKFISGDSDVDVEEFLRATTDEDHEGPEKVEARDALGKRSITCPAPWVPGWICHGHCWAIGKTGGACNGIDNVCICYDN